MECIQYIFTQSKIVKKLALLIPILFFSFHISFSQTHGKYIDFNQGSGYLSLIQSPSIIPNGDFTIEFWFKSCVDTFKMQTLFDNGTYIRVQFHQVSTGDIEYAGCIRNTTWYSHCNANHQYLPDYPARWHHVAMTYTKAIDKWEMFFDGSSNSFSERGLNVATDIQFRIGTDASGTKPFYGIMDDFRISNQVLYLSDFTPPSSELKALTSTVAVYNFNQSDTSSVVVDSSGNGNDLNILGKVYFDSAVTGIVDSIPNGFEVIGGKGPYQWYDCDRYRKVLGADSSVFKPIMTGNYSVQIGYEKCGFRSPCRYFFLDTAKPIIPIDTIPEIQVLQVYPNPFSDVLTINRGEYEELTIKIFDEAGRLVYKEQTQAQLTQVNLSKISKGSYYIMLFDEKMVLSKKLIKYQ